MADKEVLYKVYEYLSDVTPYNYDCGIICDKKCCKGNDKDGMLLFPGEEELFFNKEGFTVYYEEKYGSYAVRCEGNCNRNERPLSCRIFPYFIYLKNDTDAKPTVAPDIRALDFCPVLEKKKYISRKFLRALRISARKLASEKEFREYLISITNILTDFNLL